MSAKQTEGALSDIADLVWRLKSFSDHGNFPRAVVSAGKVYECASDIEMAIDRLRAEMAGVREAINAHNADCINQCEQRKQMGKTHCPMKGYNRECGDCPRDGMLDLDAARIPKEPGSDIQAGTVGGNAHVKQERGSGR